VCVLSPSPMVLFSVDLPANSMADTGRPRHVLFRGDGLLSFVVGDALEGVTTRI
jgi:hypothetical protein